MRGRKVLALPITFVLAGVTPAMRGRKTKEMLLYQHRFLIKQLFLVTKYKYCKIF